MNRKRVTWDSNKEPVTWQPTNWVLLEQTNSIGDKVQRLLTSIQSRYSSGEGWRLSNAIKTDKVTADRVIFRTYDNEIFGCRLKDQGFTELMESRMDEIHQNAREIHGGTVEIIEYTGENNA